MKAICTADLHINGDERSIKTLQTILDAAIREKASVITVSGDFWDKATLNTETAGFTSVVSIMKEWLKVCEVCFIYGTQRHDAPGSLDVFRQFGAKIITEGSALSILDSFIILGIPEIQQGHIVQHSDDTVKQAMDNLIISMRMLRRERSELPAICLIHGVLRDVQKPDNQLVKHSDIIWNEIKLAEIGADYYAAGHFHLPEKFTSIPGQYVGGQVQNWGECGFKAGFQILTFEGNKLVNNERVDYPHIPERLKVKNCYMDSTLERIISPNIMVWHEYPVTEEEAKYIDIDKIKDRLLAFSAHPDSKVTLNIQRADLKRSQEIMDVKTFRDMFKIWKENHTEEELKYCDILQEKAESLGLISKPKTITPISTRIRGSKMFRKGQGKAEVFFDWTAFNPGLIALTGPGGMGKSALIGYSSPYADFIGQDCNFTQTFELPDSQVENIYEVNGDKVKMHIAIKANLKTLTAKYFVFLNGQPYGDTTNGNKENYDAAVTEIFGTKELFVNSIFNSQHTSKNTPDLARASKSELRQVFSELAGIDKTEIMLEARENAKVKESVKNDSENRLDGLEMNSANLDDLQINRNIHSNNMAKLSVEFKGTENKGFALKDKLTGLRLLEVDNNEKKNRLVVLQSKIKETYKTTSDKKNKIEYYGNAIGSAEGYKKDIESYENHQKRLSEIQKEYESYRDEKEQADNSYRELCTIAENEKRDRQQKINDLSTALRDFDYNRQSKKKANIEASEKIEIYKQECPNCGFIAKENQEKIQEAQKIIDMNQSLIIAINNDITAYEKQKISIEDLPAIKQPTPIFLIEYDLKERNEIQNKMLNIDIDTCKSVCKEAETAQSMIDILNSEIRSLNSQNEKDLFAQIKLENIIDNSSSVEIRKLEDDIEGVRKTYGDCKAGISSTEADIRNIDEKIHNALDVQKKIDKLKKDISVLAHDSEIWRTMEKAFSPNGIPALELSNTAPSVDVEANKLLEKFLPRYKIQSSTLKLSAKGDRFLEDFRIDIYDNQWNDSQSFCSTNGEQRAWILEALRHGLRVVRERNTGITYNMVIDDESDRSISEGQLEAFYKMKELSIADTDKKTLIITHNPISKKMFDQVKEVCEL